jgi:hypothetical protein
MRAKEYPVLKRAVAVGVKQGWSKAHQQDQEPADDTIMQCIREAVIAEIVDAFDVNVPEEG